MFIEGVKHALFLRKQARDIQNQIVEKNYNVPYFINQLTLGSFKGLMLMKMVWLHNEQPFKI